MNLRIPTLLLLLQLLLQLAQAAPPRLRVGQPQPPLGHRHIVDEHGRQRLLRGVNIGVQWWAADGRPTDPAAYADGACPAVNATTAALNWRQPPVCGVDAGKGKWNASAAPLSRNDLAQIRSLGFNVVRLAVGWASLEPEPGCISAEYIARMAQVVEWAAEQDVWVFIDWHQDGYSWSMPGAGPKSKGWTDGAPAWACPRPEQYNDSSIIGEVRLFCRSSCFFFCAADIPFFSPTPQVKRLLVEEVTGAPVPPLLFGSQLFWQNATLQEHYIRAAAAVIKRFANSSTVLGFEIRNEPDPGAYLDPYLFAKEALYPFYQRFVQAVTGVRDGLPTCNSSDGANGFAIPDDGVATCAAPDLGVHDDHAYLFEPCVLRNSVDVSLQHITEPWTTYDQLIFAPHTYTGQVSR